MLGVAEIAELPVVFVPMEGGWQIGVQTEALNDGMVSIFVPGAPSPHSGSLFFFSRGNCSARRHQAGRCAQLPQAMWRGRIRARRQLAGRGVVPPDCQVGSRPDILAGTNEIGPVTTKQCILSKLGGTSGPR